MSIINSHKYAWKVMNGECKRTYFDLIMWKKQFVVNIYRSVLIIEARSEIQIKFQHM